MTDRIAGFIVTLNNDIREDDAKNITDAIRMIKGVLDVQPVLSDITLIMAEQRVKFDLSNKLFEILK